MRVLRISLTTLSVFLAVTEVEGHPHDLPQVGLNITLDGETLVYETASPAFAVPPLADIEVGGGYPSMGDRKREIEDFFVGTCPVTIDGIAVRPVLKSLEFRASALEGPDVYYMGEPQPAETAPAAWLDVYMTLVYGLKGKPSQVSMVWNLFAGRAMQESGLFDPVFVEFLSDPYGGLNAADADFETYDPNEVIAVFSEFGRKTFVKFTPDEPEYVWHGDARTVRLNPMAVVPGAAGRTVNVPMVPIAAAVLLCLLFSAARSSGMSRGFGVVAVAIVLVTGVTGRNVGRVAIKPFWGGVQIPEEAQAKEIFSALHRNIYRAFDYETEDDIYDALAQSVSGELLDDIYQDVYESLILRDQGGAVCKIEKVEILRSEMGAATRRPDSAEVQFTMSCTWRVLGLVEHWGHAHRRVNEYSAVYTLAPFGDKWKISDVDMLDQKRIGGKRG